MFGIGQRNREAADVAEQLNAEDVAGIAHAQILQAGKQFIFAGLERQGDVCPADRLVNRLFDAYNFFAVEPQVNRFVRPYACADRAGSIRNQASGGPVFHFGERMIELAQIEEPVVPGVVILPLVALESGLAQYDFAGRSLQGVVGNLLAQFLFKLKLIRKEKIGIIQLFFGFG